MRIFHVIKLKSSINSNQNNGIIKFVVSILFILIFIGLYGLLTSNTIYQGSIGNFLPVWNNDTPEKVDGYLNKGPYIIPEARQLLNWDGEHYYTIGKQGYINEKTFAFFPLFPLLFKLTGFSLGIMIINFMLFSVSLIILFNVFKVTINHGLIYLMLLALPTNFVFFLPYAESLFFILISVFIYAYIKNQPNLGFFALLLAGCTKPIITIFILSVICSSLIIKIIYKKPLNVFKTFIFFILPAIIGTLLSALIQYYYSGSLFKFISVQHDIWDHYFRIPDKITDWSEDGHSLNAFTIFLVVLPTIWFFLYTTIMTLQNPSKMKIPCVTHKEEEDVNMKYTNIFYISLFYIFGSFCFVLFYQGGSLNGMFRYIMCTPFFFTAILLFPKFYFLTLKGIKFITIYAVTASVLFPVWLYYFRNKLPGSTEYVFYLLIIIVLFYLRYTIKPKLNLFFIPLIVLSSLILLTYYINAFLTNSWIIT